MSKTDRILSLITQLQTGKYVLVKEHRDKYQLSESTAQRDFKYAIGYLNKLGESVKMGRDLDKNVRYWNE
jgi:DeoR/GlpR family transcriptional regulator of sugar metabolism